PGTFDPTESALFPYSTLFRSRVGSVGAADRGVVAVSAGGGDVGQAGIGGDRDAIGAGDRQRAIHVRKASDRNGSIAVAPAGHHEDRKSTRLNSSHGSSSSADL